MDIYCGGWNAGITPEKGTLIAPSLISPGIKSGQVVRGISNPGQKPDNFFTLRLL
jgi:hypothetical protein